MFGVARMNFRSPMGTIGENARTPAWVAAVVTAGGTVSSGRRALVNNVFNSLDGYGLTALLNRLWFLAAENAGSAAVDLINRQSLTLVNSPTFTANQGYAGNGTSSYLNLNSSNTGTQNSACFGLATRTNQATADFNNGSTGGGANNSNLGLKWSDGKIYWAFNDNDTDPGRTAPANTVGVYVVNRTGSTGALCYKDAVSLGDNTRTSTGTPSDNFFVGANTISGSATFFGTDQNSMAFLGAAGMTTTQITNFTNTVQTYLTAVGA